MFTLAKHTAQRSNLLPANNSMVPYKMLHFVLNFETKKVTIRGKTRSKDEKMYTQMHNNIIILLLWLGKEINKPK